MLSYIELNDETTQLSVILCTNIRISIYTILDFLVSYTPSSLFFLCCCDCQRQAKTAMSIFVRSTRSLRLYAFPYLAILRKLALYSLSYSLFPIDTHFLFFSRDTVIFSNPFCIFTEFRFSELPAQFQQGIQRGTRFIHLLMERELVICFWLFWDSQKQWRGFQANYLTVYSNCKNSKLKMRD